MPQSIPRLNTDPTIDPQLTRRGRLAHPRSLIMGALQLLFGCYAFNVGGLGGWLEEAFSALNTTIHTQDAAIRSTSSGSLPFVGAVLAAITLHVTVNVLTTGLRSVKVRRRLRHREIVSEADFSKLARSFNISDKVAKEAFHLLLPHYDNQMRMRLADDLTEDLSLTPHEVADLRGNLLFRTDRRTTLQQRKVRVTTVLDLLTAVETSAPCFLTGEAIGSVQLGAQR